MKSLCVRIGKRIAYTIHAYKADCKFSLQLAHYRMMDELLGRLGFEKLSVKFHDKKETWIQSYLKKTLATCLKHCTNNLDQGKYIPNAPIWVCWWTGELSAPSLVKKCIQSIRKQSRNHPVYLITQYNYAQYIDIPPFILEKVANGNMKLAHLSDYIRCALITKYGGLWLDATIFCSGPIPESYFEIPIFTCKSPWQSCRYISHMQWTTFVLGGWKGNAFYRSLQLLFEVYWSQESAAIDYLFFDHMIALVQKNNVYVRQQMENIPINNLHRDD